MRVWFDHWDGMTMACREGDEGRFLVLTESMPVIVIASSLLISTSPNIAIRT